ncbi:MAG TPA: superinfection immunity protein [Chloroflexota bacterium]|nr:superinfection immunity protein [Chloroflexota bacterium]
MEALGLLVLVVVFALYFLPTIVAATGSKRKTGAIFVLNLFLGWTLLGWVLSLVWAIADERSGAAAYSLPPSAAPPAPMTPAYPPAGATARQPEQPTWRPLPAPGQRVHLMTNRIVRVAPESTAASTDEFRAGTDVTVMRTSGDWVWVQTDDGKEGWIQL